MSKKKYKLPNPMADLYEYWVVDDNLARIFNKVVKYFLFLTESTCPHEHEHKIYGEYFSKFCQKDNYGNYLCWVKNKDGSLPKTMFTSHLDTADKTPSKVNHQCYSKQPHNSDNKEYFIQTDGKSILGADCKAGTALQLRMIEEGVPGLYYFFLGEEVGLKGSRALAQEWSSYPDYQHLKHCVSFDRMGTTSIISKQGGNQCCSDDFVVALIEEFKKQGLKMVSDPTGSATDSLAFIGLIPECTNLSVGYYGQHTHNEIQNISFLSRMEPAVLKIDWENLPATRTPVIPLTGKYGTYPSYSNNFRNYSHSNLYGGSKTVSKNKKKKFVDEDTELLLEIFDRLPYINDISEMSVIIKENPTLFIRLICAATGMKEEELIEKLIIYTSEKIRF